MPRKKSVAQQVKERDGMCVVCGRLQGLDAHHVDTFGAHGADNPSRMVTLCRTHHAMWHAGSEDVRAAVNVYLEKYVNNPSALYTF